MPAPLNPAFEWETVGIPVIAGLDLQTPSRLVDSRSLIRSENVQFVRGKGLARRHGHTSATPQFKDISGERVAAYTPPPHPTSGRGARDPFDPAVVLPSQWLYGYGIKPTTDVDPCDDPEQQFSQERAPGILFGGAQRGKESMAWDGFRFFSTDPEVSSDWAPTGFYEGPPVDADDMISGFTDRYQRRQGDAVMPWARLSDIPTASASHHYRADCADNGSLRAFTYINETGSGPTYHAMVTVVDSKTNTPLAVDTELQFSSSGSLVVRSLSCGDYIHVIVLDTALRTLNLYSMGPRVSGVLAAWVTRSLGAVTINAFDVRKVTESKFTILRVFNNTLLEVAEFNADGTTTAANFVPWTAFSKGAGPNPSLGLAAIAVHPVTNHICIVWRGGGNIWGGIYNATGSAVYPADSTPFLGASPNSHITVEAQYIQRVTNGFNTPVFRYFADTSDATDLNVYIHTGTVCIRQIDSVIDISAASFRGGSPSTGSLIVSNAFRAGQRVFVWAWSGQGANQHQYVLYDDQLLPVGVALQGLADETLHPSQVHSVNWYDPTAGKTLPAKDRLVFHMALTAFDNGAASMTSGYALLKDKTTAHHVELDFLPPLRSAQMGEVTYFPGAQLWSYDGSVVSEANPLSIPTSSVTSGTGGGFDYSYRIYLAWTNADGERVMGPAATQDYTNLNFPITLNVFPNIVRRPGAYYLIYRRAPGATNFFLVSSTSPDSPYYAPARHDRSTTFLDDVSTASSNANEADPHNDATLIPGFHAPCSEVIAYGGDRLWLAGGEIEPGVVRASKVHQDFLVPGWSPALQIPVKRGDRITAIGALTGFMTLFTESRSYTLEGEGPSDTALGAWPDPQLAFANEGAVSQEAVTLLSDGLTFQSRSGIRLIAQNGQLKKFGAPVDTLARTLRINGVFQSEHEVRFYHDAGALSFDEETGAWSQWSCGGVGVCGVSSAVLPQLLDDVFVEDEDVFTDNGSTYPFIVQLSWLRRGDLGDFQRIRRVGALGRNLEPLFSNGNVRVITYMDENEIAVDSWTTAIAAGNVNPVLALRRCSRQKCSVISVEIRHEQVVAEQGFAVTGVILELGKRQGLMRNPRL